MAMPLAPPHAVQVMLVVSPRTQSSATVKAMANHAVEMDVR